MRARRTASRVVILGVALALVSSGLALLETEAAWRRVSRNFEAPFLNDLKVCTDGFQFVLGTALQFVAPQTAEDQPTSFARETLRVTTEAITGDDGLPAPAGSDVLLLSPDSGVLAPRVEANDPRLAGASTAADRVYYLIDAQERWTARLTPGVTIYLWLMRLPGQWRAANAGDPPTSAVTVEDCRLFPPTTVPVHLDANVADPDNSTYPESLDFTIFELSGADIDPESVRFGAAGREAPAYAVKLGDKVYGIADLRGRGLDCSATTASVTGETATGEPFAATDVVRPICK